MVAGQLGQWEAMGLVDVMLTATWMFDSIHHHVGLLVQVVVELQGVNLKGLSNLFEHRGVALREFLH